MAACGKKPADGGGEGHYSLWWNMKPVIEAGNSVDSMALVVNGSHVRTLVDVKDGDYFFEGDAQEGDLAKVAVWLNHGEMVAVVYAALERGDITIDSEMQCAVGTPLNDAAFNVVMKAVNGTMASPEELVNYMAAHKADVASLLVVGNEPLRASIPTVAVVKLYDMLSAEMKNTAAGKEIAAVVKKAGSTLPGAKFVDFAATYKGKTQHLSDYVGKGKLVVADFWASWCMPCRQEIPNLIALHKKYGDRVVVLGIATWDEPAATEGAIAELKIPYPQIINAQKAGSDAYSIQGIPEIILFAPDGTILKRGLRGEQVEAAVKEALGDGK
ncbi:MAG: TlpA disulfide reductase family protein, partial [Bacteroidales bacterium]|nr:TlpA disulfide reductase family protein [Bacteroidales bacterium]